MTHRSNPDFARMATAALEARQRQEEERLAALITEFELVVGEAYIEFRKLYDNTDLDHDAKMARLRAAISALRGEASGVAAAPAASAPSIDLASIDAEKVEGNEPDSNLADRAAPALKAETPAMKASTADADAPVITPAAQPEKLSLLERGKRAWKNG